MSVETDKVWHQNRRHGNRTMYTDGDKGGITISGRQFFYPRIREYNSKITRQIKSLNVKEKILNFYDKLQENIFRTTVYISIGEGNGNPLQYSCLENSMDGGAWWAAVHGVTKSWTRLSDFIFFLSIVPFGEANGNPLQGSCLENPMDGEAWWTAVCGVAESDMTKHIYYYYQNKIEKAQTEYNIMYTDSMYTLLILKWIELLL